MWPFFSPVAARSFPSGSGCSALKSGTPLSSRRCGLGGRENPPAVIGPKRVVPGQVRMVDHFCEQYR